MEKYLIVGLGNVGSEYELTRHNTGFMVLDAFAKASNIVFDDRRYGFVAETSLKGRKVFLLKPSTYMNLSGNAVRYWLNKENIDQKHLLVISDDVALALGAFRLKANGSNGGHNGPTVPMAVTMAWAISSSSSVRTMRACVWVLVMSTPVADRLTGCWVAIVRKSRRRCSPPSTWL